MVVDSTFKSNNSGGDAVSCSLLRASAHWWFFREDDSLIRRCLERRLQFHGKYYRDFLSAIAGVIDKAKEADDCIVMLDGNGQEKQARLLEELRDDSLSCSPGRIEELFAKLLLPHAGEKLEELARQCGDRKIGSIRAVVEQLDTIRGDLVAEEVEAGDDIFKVQYVNDPDQENKIHLPEPWIDGLLMPGYTAVSGPWKCGKTWYMLALSISIAAGKKFFGHSVRQGRVAWLQLDMAIDAFIEYARLLRNGMGLPVFAIPTFGDGLIDLAKPGHQQALNVKLEKLETEVLFIDSGRAASSVKENDSDEVAALVRRYFCGVLRDKLNISVVLINHSAKGGAGGSRGSGDFDAAADSLQHFTKRKDGAIRVTGQGRHSPFEIAFAVDDLTQHGGDGVSLREVDIAGGGWILGDDLLQAVRDTLKESGPANCSQNELFSKLRKKKIKFPNGQRKQIVEAAMARFPEIQAGSGGLFWASP